MLSLHQILQGDEIKEDKMGGSRSIYAEMNECNILVARRQTSKSSEGPKSM